VISSTQKKLAAIVAGALLGALPLVALNQWIAYDVENDSHQEVEFTARRAIQLAEGRLNKVVAALTDLPVRGIESCSSPADLDAMHQVAFANTPIKELSVIGPDGRTYCTNLRQSPTKRKIISSWSVKTVPGITLAIVEIGDQGKRMMQVSRTVSGDGIALAALIPNDLLVPQVSQRGDSRPAYVKMITRDGAVMVAGSGTSDDAGANDRIVASHASEAYELKATVSMSRASLSAKRNDFRNISAGYAGVVSVLMLMFTVIVRYYNRSDPVIEIARALLASEFVPYYQPIVDVRTGRLQGAEVLARWRKRDGTIVSPGAFIPQIEASGLILDLTRVLMQQVRQEAGEAYAQRRHLTLAFNLTAQHLADQTIVGEVRSIFEGSQIDLSQIVLEVTEHQPLSDLAAARGVIAGLQGIGCQVAIDDVGTGHSGLSYLLKLGVDIIKIDKMFIDAIGSDHSSTIIIDSLVHMASNMRMKTVAEGVETFQQLAYLSAHGVHAAQGYVFAPPLPGSLFFKLLDAIERDPTSSAGDAASADIVHFIGARDYLLAAA
jgi:sensor c-di-GMP phosphodiesterase-like protein